jgi:branched-chain amino acid transport system permease protein
MIWTNAILQGLLVGGLYALLASGLSLVFGVMRIVNLGHGDFSILAAYLVLVVAGHSNLWLGTLAVLPIMALLGYALQRSLLNRALSLGVLSPLLITFAFSIILQNALLKIFTSDTRSIQTESLGSASLKITDAIYVGYLPLLTFFIGVTLTLTLHVFLTRTQVGRAMRATSDDPTAAELIGINNRHIYALATGIGLFAAGVAGILFGMRTQFSPSLGPVALIFAFEAVIIGGLGSLWGTLVGGIVLGIGQSIGAQINPAFGVLAGHLVFIAILLFKPEGLLSKQKGS